ncbi:MAG: FHA domain-containing protein [Nitrospirae bacterium YQR-1]
MGLVKVCPTCRGVNSSADMMCSRCFGDISGIKPNDEFTDEFKVSQEALEAVPPPATSDDRTIVEVKNRLLLRLKDGREIVVKPGDVVGRKAVGADVIADFPTVSRRHVKFTFENGKWLIEDLNSTNETYLDDVRLTTGQRTEIKQNQKLTLSFSLDMTVK